MSMPQGTTERRATAACLAAVVGLAALLLFLVQLVLGKRLLPWFGGSSAFWTTSLMFFQAALVAGYAWAHALVRLPARRQRDLQLAFVAVALGLLSAHAFLWPSPITPADGARPDTAVGPLRAALHVLASAAGLPFVLLASTGPLLQTWFARLRPERSPFRLYALSNAGSLLALLGYPLLLEPLASVRVQGWLWSAGFLLFAAGTAAVALSVGRTPGAPRTVPPDGAASADGDASSAAVPASRRRAVLWLVLSAVPSVLLLATTAHLTQEVAAVPLLWTLPLAAYLVSFVFAFGWPRLAAHPLWGALLVAAAGLAVLGLLPWSALGMRLRVVLWLLVLSVYAVACHGELVRLRPTPARLTSFYLSVACGGALGGVLNALVAPRLFAGYWELHIGILAGPLAIVAARIGEPLPGAVVDPVRALRQRVAAVAALLALAGALAAIVRGELDRAERAERGFYGVLRIARQAAGSPDEALQLVHGRIAHGLQLVAPERRREPTTYFGPGSGAGLAIARHPRRLAGEPMRVAVVGLGVGTLAAWSRPGDVFRFYELDPQVARLSESEPPVFTYLREARGRTSVVVDDGRLALEREPPQGFDVLVLDAFSSHAIPTHLLTREAFAVYRRHLRDEQGVIAVQVTNRYVDLKPVVHGVARAHGLRALHVPSYERGVLWSSEWMLVGAGRGVLDDEAVTAASLPPPAGVPELVWTDDWSDLLRVLKR